MERKKGEFDRITEAIGLVVAPVLFALAIYSSLARYQYQEFISPQQALKLARCGAILAQLIVSSLAYLDLNQQGRQ
jgi:hypothetical protein